MAKVELISFTDNPVYEIVEKEIMMRDPNYFHACRENERLVAEPNEWNKIIEEIADNPLQGAFEFADFTFLITEVTRAATHQIVRHRHMSFAQQSLRVFDARKSNIRMPLSVELSPEAKGIFENVTKSIKKAYEVFKANDIPNEDCRALLPIGTETVIFVKTNFRSLVQFCEMRLCDKSQAEIRGIAADMKELLQGVDPILGKVLEAVCEKTASCPFPAHLSNGCEGKGL